MLIHLIWAGHGSHAPDLVAHCQSYPLCTICSELYSELVWPTTAVFSCADWPAAAM